MDDATAVAAALAGLPHFRGAPRLTLALLAAGAPTERFALGERLIAAGARPDAVFLIRSGRAATGRAGRALSSRVELGPGALAGDAEALGGGPARFETVALEAVAALRLEIARLERFWAASPDLARAFAAAATRGAAL